RRRHTRFSRDWSSDVCSSDLVEDIDFNPDDFVARVNADLIGKYVNIASRTAGFITRRFSGVVLPPDPARQAATSKWSALALEARSEERRVGRGGRARWAAVP